ncbi:MAG: hypothetical protein IPK07_21445 [Deltaproteobacteria bacterium]|nr:hypothetical protein [Deltaproteobacteria bacterium]
MTPRILDHLQHVCDWDVEDSSLSVVERLSPEIVSWCEGCWLVEIRFNERADAATERGFVDGCVGQAVLKAAVA